MVSTDRGRENVWASSDYTGVLEKTTQMTGICWGGSTKCATFKIQAAEAENLRVFVGMVQGGRRVKNISLYVKIQQFVCCSKYLWKYYFFDGGSSTGRKPMDFPVGY